MRFQGYNIPKMRLVGGTAPAFPSYEKQPNGRLKLVMEPSNKKLPDVSTTDLKAVIEAGVPLQSVNPVLIRNGASEISAEIENYSDFEQLNNQGE